MSKNGVDYRTIGGTKGIVRADSFQTGSIAVPKVVLNTTLTIDPPSLTTGAFAESDFALTGVALGDSIDLYPPYDTQGIIYQASVQAADNITVAFSSCNTGTVDLASGTWGVVVKRRV